MISGLRTLRGTTTSSENGPLKSTTMLGKTGVDVGGIGLNGGKTRASRAALGDIGNKRARAPGPQRAGIAGAKKPVLGEVRKPATRGLTKQKGTASLQQTTVVNAPATVSLRSSRSKSSLTPEPVLEQQLQDEPMELGGSNKEQQDVEMEELSPEIPELTGPIEDIDTDDRENPQLAADYVNEIYAYMRQLEAEQAVNKDYLEKNFVGCAIKPRMRNLLVDWLVEVHQQFSLLQETLYLAVACLDRYLQVCAGKMTTKQLQLVGVTAMFVASKYEEMYPPEIGDFVYITDHAYNESQIRKMEIVMIETLNFDLGRPLPLNFLRRNSKAGFVDAKAHTLAKYVMELAMVEYRMAHVAPSVLAAASLAFAMRVLDPSGSSMKQLWTPTLKHYTSYGLNQFKDVLILLSEVVYTVSKDIANLGAEGTKKKKNRAVTTKYGNKKFMKIALLPELHGDTVKKMGQGEL